MSSNTFTYIIMLNDSRKNEQDQEKFLTKISNHVFRSYFFFCRISYLKNLFWNFEYRRTIRFSYFLGFFMVKLWAEI